jgi:hypothetical protein
MKCLPSIDLQLGDVKSVQKSRSDISNTVNINVTNRDIDPTICRESVPEFGDNASSPCGPFPTSVPYTRPVTKATVAANLDFLRMLNQIQTKLLTRCNADLLANMLDFSGCIILRGQDLADLISVMLDLFSSDVDIKYINVEPDYDCCGNYATPWTPKKQVHSIKIKGLDFQLVYNEAFNILLSYKISLNYVLISTFEGTVKKNVYATQEANPDVITYG